ncbi:nitrilase-related carbon-nitrogen hydrolase [Cytobacillus horneckiae]|uniref:nitrilase-related carbon-nitrogen hydrolase n=1 Tax=Cytobacillus horneckiae TaxID=549687 RepID=UPI0034CD5C88
MEVTVSCCQFEIKKLNSFSAFEKQVSDTFEQVPLTSDYVLFPELTTLGLLTSFDHFSTLALKDYRKLTDFLDDYKKLFSSLASERQQIIIAGSTLEEEAGEIYNTCFIFEPDGSIHRHRKTHIFPGEAEWDTAEGDALEVFEIGPVTFGIAICYEIEIPEINSIYQQKGADIIFCPSYTFTPHGFWRVRHCAQARAIENQVYVIHCPTKGNRDGIIYPGHGNASILSPCDLNWEANGVVVEAKENTKVITASLSMDALYDNRQDGAATTVKDRQRRKELYTIGKV